MRVLGVSGSLRRESHNRRLLRAAATLLPPEAELVPFEGLKAIPPFDEDDEAAPAQAVMSWRRRRRTHVFEDPRLEVTSSQNINLDAQLALLERAWFGPLESALRRSVALPSMAEGWDEGQALRPIGAVNGSPDS